MPPAGRHRERPTPEASSCASVIATPSMDRVFARRLFVALLASTTGCFVFGGCAEGPLHSTGWLFPTAVEHWKNEEKHGPTIHALRDEQVRLREAWPTLSPADRESAITDLAEKFERTTNQTLKLEYLRTVASASEPSVVPMLIQATGDRSLLVRTAACDALKGRANAEAQGRLRDLAESDSSIDVRLAAIRALEGDASDGTFASMKRLLEDDDPAIQYRAMATLEATTGKEYGRDSRAWLAYLNGDEPEIRQAGWFEDWIPFY